MIDEDILLFFAILNKNLVVEFAVDHLILAVDQFECMRTVAVHMAVSIGNASITKEKHNLMRRLWSEGDKVPEHVSILKKKLFI